MLQKAGAGAIGVSLLNLGDPSRLLAAPAAIPPTGTAPAPLNRFGRMMQEYCVARVRDIERAANARRAALRSKADAEAYVREVRGKIQGIFGPWPEKTSLNARITGVLKRDAYTIEKIIFESRPDLPVTANLYVPKGRASPLPGVIGLCGHSKEAKAAEPYQAFAQGLARLGYVVFIIDPLGQGERLQYPDAALKSRVGIGVNEHQHAGNQQVLVEEHFASWRAWDAVRALDYLLTRPEVDPRHIGVTGNSGGGTMTTWLCGVETRLTMAAPCCFATTFRRNLENEEVADAEQYPRRAIIIGLDHADFIAALAPKPVILLAQEKDFFDVRGLEEAFDRLQRLYALLGAKENIAMFLGPDYHGYTQLNREAMYRWFNGVTQVSSATAEPRLVLEKEETLWCTPHGQVAELKPRAVFSFTREASLAWRRNRAAASGDALRGAVTATLQLPPRTGGPEYRILRPGDSRGYPKKFAVTYLIETEPPAGAIVYRLADEALYSRPPLYVKRALLYLSHRSADAELRSETLIGELMRAEPDAAVYACDVRGIGESQPNTSRHGFMDSYGSDYFYAAHALMLDYPYLGQRTHDVLRVLDWLKACGHSEVHLVGKGWGALPATFAALLSTDVAQVTLKNALTSYSDVAESEDYHWPLSSLLPGVLRTFDLADCYRALEAKQLRQIEPWGAKDGQSM